MNAEFLKYISFGVSISICFICYFWSQKLVENPFFYKFSIVAIISTLIGVVFEVTNLFNMRIGIAAVLMSLTTIYLFYFRVLHFIFHKWKGFDPQPMSRVQDIGCYPFPPPFAKKQLNNKRAIIWEDFLFTTLHLLLPIFTIVFLLAYLNGKL